MFFGEIETKLSEDALLSASLILDNNLSKVKISKGTKIDKSIIKLLLNNNIQKIMCAKLDQDDVDENIRQRLTKLQFFSKVWAETCTNSCYMN